MFEAVNPFVQIMPLTPAVGLLLLSGRCCRYVAVRSDELLHTELDEAGTVAPSSQSTCT
jgi:hypothetical protein